MVVALGPGKFYGSSLPRPRIYTDVRFNDERVDPPVPVMDPLMSWAEEAHWSMGGLNFKRHRLQGRIEGNVEKLRAEREKLLKKAQKGKPLKKNGSASPVTPPAPVAVKRKRRMLALVDEEEDEEEEQRAVVEKKREVRKTARKLGDDFDRVANEKKGSPARSGVGAAVVAAAMLVRKKSPGTEEETVTEDGIKKKSKSKVRNGKKSGEEKGKKAAKETRSSPRLAKIR